MRNPWHATRRSLPGLLLLAAVVWASFLPIAMSEEWPQWRGPTSDGVSLEAGLPIAWSEKQNVVWRTELPEWGNSTPAVWGDALFVTAHHDEQLLLLKLSAATGQVQWMREVGQGTAPRESGKREHKFHDLHNLASPSPVTDGRTVVVHFGNGDLAAYDYTGQRLWKRNLQHDHGPYRVWWGHANSPVICGDVVVSVCMHDSHADVDADPSESYLVAHDLASGERRWKSPRDTKAAAEQGDAYTTPLVYQQDGALRVLVMGGNQLDAYDPHTGQRQWHLPGLIGGRTVSSPTIAQGMAYATLGMRGALIAVPLDQSGAVSKRAIAWKQEQGTPDSCSPVVWKGLLFVVTDDGIARCYDAVTGHLKWKERLPGGYKASPIAAEARVYFLNTDGVCTVVSASERFQKLAQNELDDRFSASPAVSRGRVFLRGRKALYCIDAP